jgi:hypothetical protein
VNGEKVTSSGDAGTVVVVELKELCVVPAAAVVDVEVRCVAPAPLWCAAGAPELPQAASATATNAVAARDAGRRNRVCTGTAPHAGTDRRIAGTVRPSSSGPD